MVYIHGWFEGAGAATDPTNYSGNGIFPTHGGADGVYSVSVSGLGGLDILSASCTYRGADTRIYTNMADIIPANRTVQFRTCSSSTSTGVDIGNNEYVHFTIVARRASHDSFEK